MAKNISENCERFEAEITGGQHKGIGNIKAMVFIRVQGISVRAPLGDGDGHGDSIETIREAIEHILPASVKIRSLRRT